MAGGEGSNVAEAGDGGDREREEEEEEGWDAISNENRKQELTKIAAYSIEADIEPASMRYAMLMPAATQAESLMDISKDGIEIPGSKVSRLFLNNNKTDPRTNISVARSRLKMLAHASLT